MRHVDLCVIGSGSGNSVVDDRFSDLSVALVDHGEPFGGTCLNAGCIPTKMFVLTAEVAQTIRDAKRFGITAGDPSVDWAAIRDRIFGRTDPIAEAGLGYRSSQDFLTLYRGTARFVGERRLEITNPDGRKEVLTADRIVLAAGSRPRIPPIAGIDAPELAGKIHTSDTIMRIDHLPKSIAILGGGVVAAEFASIFAALGSRVTLLNRSAPLLKAADEEVAEAFTNLLSRHALVRLNQRVIEVDGTGRDGIGVFTADESGIEYSYDAELLLVATGRIPNSDLLDVAAGGIETDARGFVTVDPYQRTTSPGVFALGDISNPWLLKHAANHDARVVQHNLLHPDSMIAAQHDPMPAAVFSDPQVACIGATEQALRASGTPYVKGVQRYADVAYGWALEDTTSFAKVLADPESGRILGAHIMGPQASTLIQVMIQAMATGTDARTLARGMYWIHPALPEVLENALLQIAPDPQD